jgi:hypothetical protein
MWPGETPMMTGVPNIQRTPYASTRDDIRGREQPWNIHNNFEIIGVRSINLGVGEDHKVVGDPKVDSPKLPLPRGQVCEYDDLVSPFPSPSGEKTQIRGGLHHLYR